MPALRNGENRDAGRKPTYDTGVSAPERLASPGQYKRKAAARLPRPKKKKPRAESGRTFYIRESTRLVIALLIKQLSIYKMLKRRTLACIKKLAPLFQTTETS